MKIRIIAAVATVLALVAGLVLVSNYTKGADARALAGQEMREVYLVTEPVAQGTAAEDLDEFVKLQKVPAATVPGDSIASLEEQKGKVAAVNLQPGEQLLSSRLVDPQVLAAPGTVPVPKGFQEVTFTLGPAQVVGGRVKAGDTVGVYVALEEDKDGKALVTKKLHQVLITSVQGAPAGATSDAKEGEEDEENAAPPVPEGSMLVTMALNAAEAEEMIYANSFANIWLSAEDKDAVKNNDGARIEDFYKMSRFLLVTSDPSFDKSFRAAVENRIPGDVQTVFSAALPGTPNELLSKSIGEIPSVVVLGPGVDRSRALGLAGVFDIQRPEISLVLVDQEGQDAASALRAGFYDVLDATAEPESILAVLTRAVDVAQSRRRNIGSTAQESSGATGGANSKSRVIVVTSPKGGVGKTVTAVNLAVGLGKADPMDVVLVDLDVQFGDVAPMLRMDPEHTLNDAVVGPATEDSLVLKTFLSVHPSSIYALCAPADPADGDSINGRQITHLLEQLTSQFKYVVVDTAAGLGERTLAALEVATDAVFVVGMDVPGVRAMRKQIDLLGQLGMVPKGVKVVVNAAERKTGLSVADIEETIKTPVDFVVPDSKMAVYAVNRGEPLLLLDPRDKAAARLQDLVKSFDPANQAPVKGNHRKALV